MTNPLLERSKPISAGGGNGPLEPGDTFTWHAKDKAGNITKTFTLHRTDRPYAYDLADAYNDARSSDVIRRGGKWYVNSNGEVKLGDDPDWTRRHTAEMERQAEDERARWKANQDRTGGAPRA